MKIAPLKASLDRLGLKQAELARLLDVSARTVSLWATGASPLPGPVAAYLRVLHAAGRDVIALELKSLPARRLTLDEGIYAIRYKGVNSGAVEHGDALAVLRAGRILGSDRQGVVFNGSYEFDAAAGKNTVHLRLSVPPSTTLVNGFLAGEHGAFINIVGSFERAAPVSTLVVDAGGRPLQVQLTYLGALPS